MSTFFQVGIISGLLQGVYDGNINCKQLAQHGNIGLGTFNGVDGEMIALDGVFYRIDANGRASIVNPDALTPFSVVCLYEPSIVFSINAINNCDELNKILDQHLKTKNIFYMMRIDADIDWIKLRSEGCQTLPYKSLVETLPATQHIFELTHLKGTLVTTYCPSYSANVAIAGFHHHFINQDKKMGGHVFDVKFKNAQVHITSLRNFSMALIDSNEFDTANLEIDTASMLRKTE